MPRHSTTHDATRRRREPGPLPALPTRRVMIPVTLFGVVFALLIGFNSPEAPTFIPLGAGSDGLALTLDDPTPASSKALQDNFVAAGDDSAEAVRERLERLALRWQERSPKVSVTPMDVDSGTVAFAQQLDSWLSRQDLAVSVPALNDELGEVSHPPSGKGFFIRCRSADRGVARDLALAMAPVLRGEVSIVFSEQGPRNQLDIFIEGAPRFNEAGVAYFPVVDRDA